MTMHDDNVVHFPVKLKRYRFRKEASIPRRPWIVRGLLLRRQITAIIAAGGVGKSIFGLVVALHLAAGRSLGPFHCAKRHRVAILSAEEDEDELDRRMHAIRKLYDFTNDDAEYVFVILTADAPILASADKRGSIHETPAAKELERQLIRDQIDVLVLDPFIEVWTGVENDNTQVKAAAGIIRSICRRLDIACLLMHHVRKGGLHPGDIDAARGASSFAGLIRLGFTLTNMSAEEAEQLSLASAKGLVRIDNAKTNYIPAADATHWFKFRNVVLDNADEIGGLPGDHVGVLSIWTPPGIFEGVTYEKIDEVLARIAAGSDDGERYCFAPQSKRCAMHPIAEAFEIEDRRALRILRCWQQSGLLYEDEYKDSNYRAKKGIFVDVSKRPSATAEN
ncbi:AAA family ATPase [Sinorhizobium medicae]|uniref:AAA family ATPase n=1 Tax=Sinorhizobium medicae TaxID=110321 RepID=UPI001F346D59|nr:AAA family ATPase [Sinorhizobium medicae]